MASDKCGAVGFPFLVASARAKLSTVLVASLRRRCLYVDHVDSPHARWGCVGRITCRIERPRDQLLLRRLGPMFETVPGSVSLKPTLFRRECSTPGLLGSFLWYRPGLCQCRFRKGLCRPAHTQGQVANSFRAGEVKGVGRVVCLVHTLLPLQLHCTDSRVELNDATEL